MRCGGPHCSRNKSSFVLKLRVCGEEEAGSMGDSGFPAISTHKRLSQSPFSYIRGLPRWFITSATSGGKDAWNRRSFSLVEPGGIDIEEYTKKGVFPGTHLIPPAKYDDGIAWVVKGEDKMDMLWESFNEEQQIHYSYDKGDAMKARDGLTAKTKMGEEENMIARPVSDIELSRGRIANQSKQNFLAMIRSLKRILSIQRSRRANREAVKGNGLCPKPKSVKR